jgi:S1-C subfamily serine protease
MRQDMDGRIRTALRAGAARVRGLQRRTLTAAVAALVAIAAATGSAFAQTASPAEGTGVVVIKTTLAYQKASAAGTGMVLTSSGEILTNNHVIRGATAIKIVVPATGRRYAAKVVGYSLADDVAVLQTVGASNLATVATARSSKVSVGDAVTAVGNAGGTGTLSSATGSVAGLHQSIVVGDDQGGTARLTSMIGVNADVVPGDSGGPLLNSAGEVIGMDTAGSTGYADRSSSQAYAIPIAKALSIAKQIEAGRSSSRVHVGATPFLGVQVAGDIRRGGFSPVGAVVSGVVSGSPAALAGLSPGDVITAINGRAISASSVISSVILTKKPGAKVTIIHIDQLGQRHSTTVGLASGPAQ